MSDRIVDDARRVAQRAHGTHFCLFYRSRAEVLELLPPFFADGIAQGHRAIWALPDWLEQRAAVAAIERGGARLERALEDGTLQLVAQEELYGDGRGGFRGITAVLDHWIAEEKISLSRGFLGLRVSGDGTWHASPEHWLEFLKYERTVDELIGQTKIAALCTYDLNAISSEQLQQTLSSHKTGVLRRPGGWEEFGCDAVAPQLKGVDQRRAS